MISTIAACLILSPNVGQAGLTVRFVEMRDGSKGKWVAKTSLPKFSGAGALAKLAQRVIGAEEEGIYADFVKEARTFFAAPDFSSPAWEYESSVTAKLLSGSVLSFVSTSYRYTGGAHGMGITRTYNFGLVNGRPKRLRLIDVLAGRSALRELELRLLEKAMATPGTDWIEGGEVRDFSTEQLDRFWIGKTGMSFEFNPYELGSYASGAFTFAFHWKELSGLLNSHGPLKQLVGKNATEYR